MTIRIAPLGNLGSHRRQTVDALIDIIHRLAAGGYENFMMPNRLASQVALSGLSLTTKSNTA